MYKEIDPKTLSRYSSFKYFSNFDNPCYGFNVEIDITKIFYLTKYRQESIFINLLYIVCLSLNEIPEMRMRLLDDGRLIIHDIINPGYLVMTDSGAFENCGHKMSPNYETFYNRASKEIESNKHKKKIREVYNDSSRLFDEFYITCIPWLEFTSISHPIPTHSKGLQSVPRVTWSKFYEKNNRVFTTLNINVSHALVDGKQLSDAFLLIQENLNKTSSLLKRKELN